MYEQLPNGIKDENDLILYEKFLHDTDNPTDLSFIEHLINNKNKRIKVEILICGKISARCGILSDVGNDFIIIKPSHNGYYTAIKLSDIKYVTFLS